MEMESFVMPGEIRADHTVIVKVPDHLPVGPVTVTVSVSKADTPKLNTLGELVSSGLLGMWSDRDDLPNSNEEFLEWRRKLWERKAS